MSSSSYAEFFTDAVENGNLQVGAKSTELVPAGQYTGQVVYVKPETKPDGKRFGLKVEITEGPLTGQVVWVNLNLIKGNPKGATAFFITAEKFGLTHDFFFRTPAPTDTEVANYFKDTFVDVTVKHREWNNRTVQDGSIDRVKDTGRTAAAPSAPLPPVVPHPIAQIVHTQYGTTPPVAPVAQVQHVGTTPNAGINPLAAPPAFANPLGG